MLVSKQVMKDLTVFWQLIVLLWNDGTPGTRRNVFL
jgi:hypothetical protein